MYTRRDLVIKTLNFDSPDRIPRQMWLLKWAQLKHPEFTAHLQEKYPDDIVQCPALYKNPPKLSGGKFTKGKYIDEWACEFHTPEEGVMGIVPKPLIKTWEDLDRLRPPVECLDLDVDTINAFCQNTDQFVYSGSIVRPFERFQFIRTMEQSFIDVMCEEAGYLELLKILHDHFLKEVEAWAKTDVDAVFLMDDWGTQQGLMVPPQVFRSHFKPMYRDYCEIAHSYGKYVFMHSDGYITDIIEDLIEAGIDCLNSQVFCMDIPELGERFAGRITFWGEIDRQDLLPNASLEQIDAAVEMVYKYLWKKGGLIAQSEFGLGAKPENVEQVFKRFNSIIVN